MNAVRAHAERWVPSHLRHTYPADFTLFLFSVGMAVWYFPPHMDLSTLAFLAATTTAVLLFFGWLLNSAAFTRAGAIVGAGTWIAQFVYLLSAWPFADLTRWKFSAALLCSAGMVNLAVGVWRLLLPDRGARGPWWLTHPRPSP